MPEPKGGLGHLPMILCFQPELNRLMGLGANDLATSFPSHLVRLRAVKRNPVKLQQKSVSVKCCTFWKWRWQSQDFSFGNFPACKVRPLPF